MVSPCIFFSLHQSWTWATKSSCFVWPSI